VKSATLLEGEPAHNLALTGHQWQKELSTAAEGEAVHRMQADATLELSAAQGPALGHGSSSSRTEEGTVGATGAEEDEPPTWAMQGRTRLEVADVVDHRPTGGRVAEESEYQYVEGLGWGRPTVSVQHSTAAAAAATDERRRWQERRGSYAVLPDEQAANSEAIGEIGVAAEVQPQLWHGVERELARETARVLRQEAEERARTAAAARAAAEQRAEEMATRLAEAERRMQEQRQRQLEAVARMEQVRQLGGRQKRAPSPQFSAGAQASHERRVGVGRSGGGGGGGGDSRA